jgi:anti-sigma B factor antagonist
MSFDCTIERQGDTMRVTPEGDIDAANAPLLREVLRQVLETGEAGHIEVTMRDVTFLDSSGLGMLVAAQRAAIAKGRTLILREAGPVVRMVLEVTHLDGVLLAGGDAGPAAPAVQP